MIEKSLTAPRKKKVKGQLHKLAYITDKEAKLLQKFGGQKVMTPEKIPAYPPPGERGGPGSGAEGRSPGGGGNGGGGGAAAQAAASAAAAARSRAAAAEAAAKSQRDMQAAIAQAERAEANRVAQQAAEGKVDVGFQEALKKTADARQREEEFLDTGDYDVFANTTLQPGPKVDIRDIQGEVTDPDSVSYDKLTEVLDSPDVDEGFKRYVRQVQQPIAPTPKSGFGTVLKNIALGVVAPQLLAGTALAKPYNLYRQYQTAKRFIPKGVQETIRTALTRTPTTMARTPTTMARTPTTITRKTTPFVGSSGDGQRVKTVAEKVATGQGLESGAKLLGLSDAQQNYIRKIIAGKDRRELQMIAGKAKISIDSGKASQIEKDVFQMIQEYLV